MPDLDFRVERVEAIPYAASPSLAFKLAISSTPSDARIHTILLRCQVQIEATRRRYAAEEQPKLLDLFGKPDQWARTLRNLHWMQTQLSVPGFTGSTVVDLPVACTCDVEVTAAKYFDALPVLVGEEGQSDTMLSAPIILYDYPQVAAESPGDFFDCTEIDELLTLRVLTLTEQEKSQMRSIDGQTRALLQRAEGLGNEGLQGLHGTIRQRRPLAEEE